MAATPRAVHALVFANRREISLPQTRAGQFQDLPRLGAPDEFLQRSLDRSRVGSLAAQPNGLLEQSLVKHKICTFHTHEV